MSTFASTRRPPSDQGASLAATPGRPPLVDIAALEKKRTSGLKGIFNHGKPSEKLEIIQQQQAYIQQLQAQMDAMGADMQNMAAIKAQAQSAADWQHRWNFQNFKINLLVDMLVLRVMEKGGAAAAAHGGSSGPTANMTVQDM